MSMPKISFRSPRRDTAKNTARVESHDESAARTASASLGVVAPGEPTRTRLKPILWASALAGVVGGLSSVVYILALDLAMRLLWPDHYALLPHWGLLVITGALISTLLVVLGDPGETGVLIDSVHVPGGAPRLRPLLSLVPVSVLSISVGGGIGPEPPLMQTTGTIGTWIGSRLGATRTQSRILTVTGMASGLTVLFAAPLGAAVFALEILHRKGLEYYEALIPACVGSAASYGVYVLLTGRGLGRTWPFPDVAVRLHPIDLLLGFCAGVGGGVIAHVFKFLVRTCTWIFAWLPAWVRPPAAGVVLGALAYAFPYGLTFGESHPTELLRLPSITAPILVLAAVGHMLSAAITLAGRWKGGIIIPMFLVGYCSARAATMWSGQDSHSLILATSMMVACNVGMTKTPLGSTLVIAQMTGVGNLPPLLIAALTSLALTTRVTFIGGQRHRESVTLSRAQPGRSATPNTRLSG